MGNRFSKDPDAIKDYYFDWREWLDDGDSVDSYTVTATGVTVASHSNDSGLIAVWLSGGTVGTSASVTCRIVTTGGRTDDKTMLFQIRAE